MVLKFNEFINEETVNESPEVTTDMTEMEMPEGYSVDEMMEMIEEGAKCYEADHDDSHTYEGYLNEVYEKLHEAISSAKKKAGEFKDVAKSMVNTKSAKTQAFAAPPEQ